MTFKFLDWVSELGKWLDWLAVYPQRGCRKREASFSDYVIICTCGVVTTGMTLGHPVEGSQQVVGEKGMNVCLHTYTCLYTYMARLRVRHSIMYLVSLSLKKHCCST